MAKISLKKITTDYLKKSRDIDFTAWEKDKKHLETSKFYKKNLHAYAHISPECIDERPRAKARELTHGQDLASLKEAALKEKISLRPSMAGGSSMFLIALGISLGYTYKQSFRKTQKICSHMGWKMKAHIDDHAGDTGCGFAANMPKILNSSLKRLKDLKYPWIKETYQEFIDSQQINAADILKEIRKLHPAKHSIAMATGSHKAKEANILLEIESKGKTVNREELFDSYPTFPVSMDDVLTRKLFSTIKSVYKKDFTLTQEQFAILFLEIHLTTFELLGVLDPSRKNIYLV